MDASACALMGLKSPSHSGGKGGRVPHAESSTMIERKRGTRFTLSSTSLAQGVRIGHHLLPRHHRAAAPGTADPIPCVGDACADAIAGESPQGIPFAAGV